MKLTTALKKKGAHIYYNDRGSWVIYSRQPRDDNDSPKELASGDDWDGDGYAGSLVTALAEMVGLTIDSA